MVDGWFGMTVVTVFVLTTALCAVSLATHGPRRGRRVAAAEANHVVMGVAMILMATPATAGLVPPVAGAVLFGAAGVGWLVTLVAARVRSEPLGSAVGLDRCTAHPAHLLLVDAAMLVMYLAMVPAAAPSAAPSMAGMPGMDMPGMDMSSGPGGEHAGHATTSPTLLIAAAVLALYLVVHAVATIAVVVRRSHGGAPEAADAPAVGTPEPSEGGGVAVAAPAVPRAVAVLAHGPVQLIGQAGMSLAMAAMLFLI
ncbi:DUF5134 domain-containing protein [Actinomycetospora endophytica]|uniref:DUF5134 domain-containing protein n=1 Tax=Actinomycetospora endophytica TaxID=2291215 RepID=A0ABS8P1T8_9PSEU|nr:DUF5134 domain-containing protein [Actinomycetospora endophytica]MCD2192194.1 DUF5134 domain-containing protein [Actinomycetospora endophytica]